MLLRRYHEQPKEEPEKKALSDLSYDELKSLAKDKGIEDYHKMKKAELIDALKDSEQDVQG
ncbi:Rho termination factor N-terminal domain-containing protein [Peptoanaerobacter stomatis]|jgi:hypothetical protein